MATDDSGGQAVTDPGTPDEGVTARARKSRDRAAKALGMREETPDERGEPFTPATTLEQVADARPVERKGDLGLTEYLRNEDAYDEDAEKEATYRRIIEQVMSAESIEEVLTPAEAIGARDITAVPLVIQGFDVNQSEYDVGSPYYASMKCKRGDTGEDLVVNTGNQRIMAQLIRIAQLNQFPVEAYIRQAKRPNRHGSFPLSLDSRPPDMWR